MRVKMRAPSSLPLYNNKVEPVTVQIEDNLCVHPPLHLDVEPVEGVDRRAEHHACIRLIGLRRVVVALQRS